MKKLLLLTFISFSFISYSQNNIVASGNDATSTSGKSSYSVGLIHYKDAEGTGGSSSAGTQIAYEVTELLSVDEENLVSLNIYPNPTSDFISINLKENTNLDYKLLDLSGKEIESGTLSNLENKINLNALNTAVYLLNIYQNSKQLKSYKIVKK